MIVRKGELCAAMRRGARLDASDSILSCIGTASYLATPSLAPPFLLAGFQSDPLIASTPRGKMMGVRDFERLSLCARAERFGEGRFAASLKAINVDPSLMPEVDVSEIEAALGWATDVLAAQPSRAGAPLAAAQGLQLIGFRIKSKFDLPLTLSNTKLPVSLSLVGCVFETPLIMDNCELVSLDLSGSALPGLQANGVHTLGDIHLRRTTIGSPIGLSGARVGGRFDGSDLLAFPAVKRSAAEIVDNDYGILNLSQAVIENELHLDRARLWGGLSLRGARAQRQIYLSGALVASPLSVIEKYAYDILRRAGVPSTHLHPNEDFVPLGEVDRDLAVHVLHSPNWPKDPTSETTTSQPPGGYLSALRDLECLETGHRWDVSTLRQMLGESMRARAGAIRADSLSILGNLEAAHLYAGGRIRMKYCDVRGAVRFGGATLNSPESSRAELQRLRHIRHNSPLLPLDVSAEFDELMGLRDASGQAFAVAFEDDLYFPQDYSVDLRNSSVSDVEFSQGEQIDPALLAMKRATRNGDHRFWAQMNGRFALEGAKVEGSVSASEVLWLWRPKGVGSLTINWKRDEDPTTKGKILDTIEKARVDLSHGSRRDQAEAKTKFARLGAAALLVGQAKIGDDVDLTRSIGLWGADFSDADIAGSVKFCAKSRKDILDDKGNPTDQVELPHRADQVTGEVRLRGARIGGDVHLVFDADRGPDIRADLVRIGGRLDIYPARSARNFSPRDEPRPEAFWWKPCEHRHAVPGARCSECAAVMSDSYPAPSDWSPFWPSLRRIRDGMRRIFGPADPMASKDERLWYIDLRNASATVFAHPPGAWAHPQATSLEGFRYERSSNLGPLPPIGLQQRREGDENRRQAILFAVASAILAMAAVVAALLFWFWAGARNMKAPSADDGGLFVLFLLPTVWIIGGVIIHLLDRILNRPRLQPAGVEYLARQRTEPNRFQHPWIKSEFVSLDPYVIAAKALREGGRTMSAEEIEYYRLKQQAHILSFRRQAPLKFLMLTLDQVAGYGFRSGRLATITLFFYVAIALTSKGLAHNEWIELRPTPCVAASTKVLCKPALEDETTPRLAEVLGLMVPIPGQPDWPWQVRADLLPKPSTPAKPVPVPLTWLEAAPSIIRLFGVFLIGVFALSIAARVETVLSRRTA